ncbi:hypothetical protein FVQ98_00960 [Ottowia sp. GY511]|uniref:Uncharacterized protein n=1 Tax=Ottowia flava TaxID=2675430 RepID=A0ABW4KSI5_9BURK|nr:hypothetical protein [Ottowia sp. GY511]TXK33478.1 hypothetical protein FVQ98_00960 [Ottowia sp. GY511]
MGGELSPIGLLLMAVGGLVSFLLGRYLSRGWRAKRRDKEAAAKLASETRQQRRARERKASKQR